MERGVNSSTHYAMTYIGKRNLEEIEIYVKQVLNESCEVFESKEEVFDAFDNFLNNFFEATNYEEREVLKRYTGLDFRKVNSILRGIWDYEKNGALTEETKKDISEYARALRSVLLKAPSLPFNMNVYRGLGIEAFYSYGISNLNDLICLKGKYMYEDGFTSTSLLKTNSFFTKPPEWGSKCNIEMECLVPASSEDGVALILEDISYSSNQLEFLINSSSLFKVIDVIIDEKNNSAKIKTILIPQKIWSPLDYEMERNQNKLS